MFPLFGECFLLMFEGWVGGYIPLDRMGLVFGSDLDLVWVIVACLLCHHLEGAAGVWECSFPLYLFL